MLRDRLSLTIPAAVLVVVATWQAIRVETHDQSPWAGAGFAMFTTVDSGAHRTLIIEPADQPGTVLPLPEDLERAAERLVAAPTDEAADLLAAELAGRRGVGVTVEVWRPVFDAGELRVDGELIARGSAPP